MGEDAAGAAARALRLLTSPDMRHPPRTAPTERRAPSTTPRAPLDLGLIDYLTEHVSEIVTHTRKVTATPTPIPAQAADIYDWYVQNTGDAADDQRAYRDTLIERHRLEHAVRLGEYDVVCKEPCPRCGRWGVMWKPEIQRAMCTNRRCRTPQGLSSTWTLTRLAAQKIQRTEIWRRNAT